MTAPHRTPTADRPARVHRSRWPAVEVPDVGVPEYLLDHPAARADAPAVIDGPSGRTLTYGDLRRDVHRCARGLANRGFVRGDVLAIVAPNVPEWLVGCFGAMSAGGVVSGINPLSTPEEIAAQLRDGGARWMLTIPPFLPWSARRGRWGTSRSRSSCSATRTARRRGPRSTPRAPRDRG